MSDPADRIPVTELPVILKPDPRRTVIRPFLPSDPPAFAVPGHPRTERIIARIMDEPEGVFARDAERVKESLDARHRDVETMLLRRFDDVADCLRAGTRPTDQQKLLIGAYLSAEYSFESAALFNPSIVPAPDQRGAADGATRFIVALRGIGEGHLSSVTFRTGTWNADGSVTLDDASETAVAPVVVKPDGWQDGDAIQLDCAGSHDPSETVLFPVIDSQARGIEDLRLTPFQSPDGRWTYAGTFTGLGLDGITQQMLQTDDFRNFTMRLVLGDLAQAKGMALFPRKVGDRWLAIGRQDNENLWLARSDDLLTWDGGDKLLAPEYPWEFTQIGNCGSPIEIDEGWLLLTHGVGVVRNYCMGAALLDRDDPGKVLGRLATPLLEPDADDRDGYVPNVVYSCGGMVRGRSLLLPYGVADNYARFCTVSLDALVPAILANPPA